MSVKLRNINPLGYVDLPLIGRQGPAFDANGDPTEAGSGCLIPGEVFEVSDAHAKVLLAQVENYVLAEAGDGLDRLNAAQLKQHAADHGIDVGGATKKAELLAAIRKG